jgi:hypothetical protein
MGLLLLLLPCALAHAIPQGRQSKTMFQSRAIGLILIQYATDHGGKYPEGKSSTEIFQKLLDEKYALDPSLFYYPMPGKTKAETTTLKSENVGWDVTCCIDAESPDNLPMVFLTGYKVTYQAGAKAVPLKGLSKESASRSWSDWWHNKEKQWPIYFTAVCYKGASARALQDPEPDGSFPTFIPTDFDPKGKTYRQLTPDGTIPP